MGAQESKLSFRRGIFRLHEERNIDKHDQYWTNYWTLPESAEDIFTLFSSTDIRKARDEAPENLETLVLSICDRLFYIRHDSNFPSDTDLEAQMLNCLRILTRIIPFLFEDQIPESEAAGFLWTVRNDDQAGRPMSQESTPTMASPSKPQGEDYQWRLKHHDTEKTQTIAEQLTKVLVELLFFCGFTIPASYGNEKVVYGIWETGVGCTVPMGTTRQYESNKIETLRCLLALISRGMYVPANETRDNRHITHLVMTIPKNVVLALLCSLLNTTMKFNPTTWRTIPYTSAFLSDSRQLLVSYSLQFLLVVLCYPLPKDGAQIYDGHTPDGESGPVNQFRHYFRKLHRASDFNFMVEGMSRVLHQPLSVSATYLPGSQTPVRFYPEMLLLFWESLQQNKRFRAFLIETDRALDFLVVLLFYALEHKTNLAQIGLVRMCVFILQPLSSEPKFARSLNKVFEGQSSLPTSVRIPSFSGTYADFLIISVYSLIATSKGQLVSLYSALFMTLSNIAPYIRNISVVASSKLVQLFSSISQPSFLFANDSNFRLLQYTLEVLNSIIEHNFNSNPHLIYAILRSHARFEALQDLTLHSGMQIVSDLKAARSKRAKHRSTNMDQISNDDTNESVSPVTSTQEVVREANDLSDVTTDAGSARISTDFESEVAERPESSRNALSNPLYKSISITKSTHSRKASLSSDLDFPPPSPQIMSEKARGKLPEGIVLNRQNSSSSLQSTHSISQQSPGGDENFDPSSAWFEAWFSNLDMSAIVVVLNSMAEEVTRLTQETPDPRPIIKYLQNAKLEGVNPHTPNPRTFVWSEQAKVWFESLLFGYIYLSETQISNGAVGVWTGTNVKLFRVQNDPKANDPTMLFKIGQFGQGVDSVANQLVSKFSSTSL